MTTGEIMTLLAVRDFHFKHNLGQNFLSDDHALDEIIRLSGCTTDDPVLEIGAGAGTLTAKLADAAKQVYAVEIDEELSSFLEEVLRGKDNVSVICQDILSMDLASKVKEWAQDKDLRVISNLPYYITSDIMEKLVLLENLPQSMTVMVQKEAAVHLLAHAGQRNCTPLSVMLEYLYRGDSVLDVPRTSFDPQPHIDSTVLHFEKKETSDPAVRKKLWKLLRISFRMRRKTWVNNLYPQLFKSREEAVQAVRSLGLDDRIRPEQVLLSQFLQMIENMP